MIYTLTNWNAKLVCIANIKYIYKVYVYIYDINYEKVKKQKKLYLNCSH